MTYPVWIMFQTYPQFLVSVFMFGSISALFIGMMLVWAKAKEEKYPAIKGFLESLSKPFKAVNWLGLSAAILVQSYVSFLAVISIKGGAMPAYALQLGALAIIYSTHHIPKKPNLKFTAAASMSLPFLIGLLSFLFMFYPIHNQIGVWLPVIAAVLPMIFGVSLACLLIDEMESFIVKSFSVEDEKAKKEAPLEAKDTLKMIQNLVEGENSELAQGIVSIIDYANYENETGVKRAR